MVAAAKRHGTIVSYDLNCRPSLWKGIGGVERAREVNRRIAEHIDVVVATTLRTLRSATVNDWSAIAWSRETGFAGATPRPGLEILDRVGGGDSFASGLIYGLLEFGDLRRAVEYGAAHGALALTTPGDTSSATLAEVETLVRGTSARIQR